MKKERKDYLHLYLGCEEIEKLAGDYADGHAFRVPFDGTNNFYDDKDFKWSKEGFIAGYKAALQNKVSDISSDKFYKLFKDELLVKCDRLLRDKGMSSAESNGCIGQAFDDTMEEYAAIVNERKDSTQLHQDF